MPEQENIVNRYNGWLMLAWLVKVYNTHTPKLPLATYREDIFKLYLLDVGLLGAMIKVSQRVIVKGSTLFSEFNGAFVENYAAQELVANGQKDLYYWTSKNQAEVDFVVAIHDQVLPLEVKAGVSKQKKASECMVTNTSHTSFPAQLL